MKEARRSCGVVMDFDGTLTSKSVGGVLRVVEDAGGLPEPWHEKSRVLRDSMMARASAGKLSDGEEREWFNKNIQYWEEGKVTLATMRGIYADVKLRDGVRGALWFLKQRKVSVAIVSFGIRDAIEMILQANGALEYVSAIYAARLIADPRDGFGGRVLGYDRATVVFPSQKGACSRQFARERGIPLGNLFAVGDSGGDRYLGYYKRNRVALARDKQEGDRFRRFMGEVIVTESFHPVTEWLIEAMRSS